jgi:hypothetical protein
LGGPPVVSGANAPQAATPAAAAPAAPPAQLLPEIDWAFAPEPDLDLDLPKVAPRPPAPSPPAAPPPAAPAPPVVLGEPSLATTRPAIPRPPMPAPAPPAPTPPAPPAAVAPPIERGTQPQPAVAAEAKPLPAARRHADLLAEAEVFRKHGLAEKAHDRLRTILTEEPKHAGALALSTLLSTDEGRFDRALGRAQQLERLAAELPAASEIWESVRPKLEKAGFRFENGAPVAPPEPKKAKKDSVTQLLDELAGLSPRRPPAKRAPAKGEPDLAALVEGLAAPRPQPKPAAPAQPPLAASAHLRPQVEAQAPAVPPVELGASLPVFDAEDAAIDDKLSWLDEAAARAALKPVASAKSRKPAADDLFADEEGFFDLAAELEEELTKEGVGGKDLLTREEPTLEEIVEGFKKGVAESLSPEDYDTHFNLGIAYREMGLLDEAIGEFQLAAKHERYLLDCCSLLGGCFLEKGLPELAIKWFQRGLATPNLTEEANLGLLYDLGNLYFATDDLDHARRTFVELYGINSNYRDVVAKLEELGSR